jgi:hypothetical protein
MSYGPDPFDARQREALRATDALLDRIGSRLPTPEDLDDPLVAALALMAAEIDLDGVPVEATRAAVERDLPVAASQVPPARPDAVVDERTGLVLDLRDGPASDGDPDAAAALRRRLPGAAAELRPADGDRALRRPRRPVSRPAGSTTGAIAPPRSLPRSGSRPSGRPEARRPRRLNPAAAFVAVIAALVLGTGVSAAVTGGRSVNPLIGLQQVVAQLTGGRTAEQQDLYAQADGNLKQARAALDRGDRNGARGWLKKYTALKLDALTDEDKKALAARLRSIDSALDR